MTPDEITSALGSSDAPPSAALKAGLGQADELAPTVYAIADKFCRGVCLLPQEQAVLFYGLHILAAARHPELRDHLVTIAGQPESDLERLFPDHVSTCLARLLLSVWDDDADTLFKLIEHPDLTVDARWALFDVLARRTFDGRIPRARTIAFLDRLEREDLIEPGDIVWWGWEDAVTRLGIRELEPTLRRVWSKVAYDHHNERDHAESLERLNRAAADPTNHSVFDQADVRLIEDPVEAVAWVERRAKLFAGWRAEREAEDDTEDNDPGRAVRLTDEELDWLGDFLVSRQVPDSTMTLEMLDGLLTALVIGPAMVMPSEYMPAVWGTDDGAGPEWDSIEQAQYFLDLLARHWNAIAARRNADALHDPFVVGLRDAERGWAEGFAMGIDLGRESWDSMLNDKRAVEIVAPIMALAWDDDDEQLPEMRADIVEHLPVILQSIARYWRDPEQRLPPPQPVRSTKVGRNEPCPCGSGKKFKKCCGAAPPVLH